MKQYSNWCELADRGGLSLRPLAALNEANEALLPLPRHSRLLFQSLRIFFSPSLVPSQSLGQSLSLSGVPSVKKRSLENGKIIEKTRKGRSYAQFAIGDSSRLSLSRGFTYRLTKMQPAWMKIEKREKKVSNNSFTALRIYKNRALIREFLYKNIVKSNSSKKIIENRENFFANITFMDLNS